MTKDDQVFELQEKLSKAVHNLVNEMLANVSKDIDDEVRENMTETFRFWKRIETEE